MNRALIERTLAAMDKGYMGHHHAEYAAVMEALKVEIGGPKPEKAYICNGCGAIYWESNVSCGCAVPALNQFTLADVYTKGTP